MNEHLRDRILRRLDALSDERGYQVLDYVEFLESRYAERQTATSAFSRFTDAVEDRLRAGKVSATAIAETMSLMNRAANVLGGALAATQKMANELVSAPSSSSSSGASVTSSGTAPAPAPTPAATQTPPAAESSTATATTVASAPASSGDGAASSPAGSTEAPGASGEKL